MGKLYKISFKEFLNNNPDIRVMEPDIQENRYQHYENKRNEKISKAIERRKEMIENPDKVFSKVNNNQNFYYEL
jgi:hypothetical protein